MGTEHSIGQKIRQKKYCSLVPSLLSAFVDTFVDYAVGGQFLGFQPIKSSNVQQDSNSSTQEGPLGHSEIKKKHGGPGTPTIIPAPERLIAIGDIHGDLNKAKAALLLAQVMDEKEQWVGGKTVVVQGIQQVMTIKNVQVGDLLDRGDNEIKIIYLLEKLKREAQRNGGDVHIMTGNHEIMNVAGNFHYTTQGAQTEFGRWAAWHMMGNVLKERCKGHEKPYDFFKNLPKGISNGFKARMAALRPGGPISSRFLAPHPVVLVVGGTVFVHGGLLQSHIDYGLDKINNESREWMEGKTDDSMPKYLDEPDSPVWERKYADGPCDCKALEEVLGAIPGAKRMVMGHTIQYGRGINAVCGNKAVRVDVGMSQGCEDHNPEVLEIQNDNEMTALSAVTFASRHHSRYKGGLANLETPKNPAARLHVTTPNL